MDKYFYSIEQKQKEKVFHLLGNIYSKNQNSAETHYHIIEWKDVYLTIEQAMNFWCENILFGLNDNISLFADITSEDATYICDTYFNGHKGKYKSIEKIDENIQCGNYWFKA